jgi:hypothetical protein
MRYVVNGIHIDSDMPLAGMQQLGEVATGREDLLVQRRTTPRLADLMDMTPVYRSRHQLPNGEPLCTIYRLPDGDVYCVGTRRLEYVLAGNRVDYCVIDPAWAPAAAIFLVNFILSSWAEVNGILTLHASAVVLDGHAVAFSAASHAGKSSLATAFVRSGCPFITDDLLGVRYDETTDRFYAHPGQPHMRMWPDLVEALVGQPDDFERVLPHSVKRLVRIGAGGWGSAASAPSPLSVLYVPERVSGLPDVDIRPLTGAEAMVALTQASFVAAISLKVNRDQPARLRLFAQLAQQVSVRVLRYPSGYDRMPAVRDAVRRDVAQAAAHVHV